MKTKPKNLAQLLIGLAGSAFIFGLAYSVSRAKKIGSSLLRKYKTHDFAASVIVLAAALVQEKGELKSEAYLYAKKFFVNNFGKETAGDAMLIFKDSAVAITELFYRTRKVA